MALRTGAGPDQIDSQSSSATAVDRFEPATGGFTAQASVGGSAPVSSSTGGSPKASTIAKSAPTNSGLKQTNQSPAKGAKGRTSPSAMKKGGASGRTGSVKKAISEPQESGKAPAHLPANSNDAKRSYSRRGRGRSKPRTKQSRKAY